MWRLAVFVLVIGSVGCPKTPRGASTTMIDVRAHLVQIARAEALRAGGEAELLRYADDPEPELRAVALRGLARIGTKAAIERLIAEASVDDAGAIALGIAASLEPLEPAVATQATYALLGAPRSPAVIEALGRAGTIEALRTITDAFADSKLAVAAGIALGRFGRRGIAPDEAAIQTAAIHATSGNRDERYAAAYGLARSWVAPAEGATAPGADVAAAALANLVTDGDPEIRAVALAGLAKRGAREAAGAAAIDALRDLDWRVAVEAVRLLAGPGARPDDVRAVATHAAREWARIVSGDAPAPTVHVVMEALSVLADDAADAQVRAAIDGIARSLIDLAPSERPAVQQLAAAHVEALAFAALAHPGEGGYTPSDALVILEGLPSPSDEVVGALVAGALASQLDTVPEAVGGLVDRASELQAPGRRAPVIGELGGAWSHADRDQHAKIIAALVAALGRTEPELAGTAAEVVGDLTLELRTAAEKQRAEPPLPPPPPEPARPACNKSTKKKPCPPPVPVQVPTLAPEDFDAYANALADALLARLAGAGADPELESSLLGAAGKIGVGREACETAYGGPNPAVRAAARECLTHLNDGQDPGPSQPTSVDAPPAEADPAAVIGAEITWTVETTRGTVEIALDARAAPWHVATIVALTRRHFYDGLVFHRVVPGFVVQGGDPAGTGWGGPGFTLPSEPSNLAYDTGAVGIADAGKDTGGSQWFAMHEAAPHLAARYTVVGELVSGQPVIDQLLVGDAIIRATVSFAPISFSPVAGAPASDLPRL